MTYCAYSILICIQLKCFFKLKNKTFRVQFNDEYKLCELDIKIKCIRKLRKEDAMQYDVRSEVLK